MKCIVEATETERRWEVARGWGVEGCGKWLLNGYGVSFKGDKNFLEWDNAIGCTMYIMPLNCTQWNC